MIAIGWIVWGIACVIALGWCYGIRRYVRAGLGITQQTVNTTALMILAVIGIPALSLSRFHLLWVFPAAWIVGTLSLVFPFSLVSILGIPLRTVCCWGIDEASIQRQRDREARLRELVAGGVSHAEAMEQVELELPRRFWGQKEAFRYQELVASGVPQHDAVLQVNSERQKRSRGKS
jgi:uncharacterized protein YoaH (UPF0181 family)